MLNEKISGKLVDKYKNMKKTAYYLPLFLLITMACNKKENGNTGIIAQDNTNYEKSAITNPDTPMDLLNTAKEITYAFKAIDGSRAIATITNTDKENTIVIKANRNMFQLDRKEITKNGAVYERNGVAAEIKSDSLIITQGNLQIDLVYVPN